MAWVFSQTVLLNAPQASCKMCAIHAMWLLKPGNIILEASDVDCGVWVIKLFEEALSDIIPSKRLSVIFK